MNIQKYDYISINWGNTKAVVIDIEDDGDLVVCYTSTYRTFMKSVCNGDFEKYPQWRVTDKVRLRSDIKTRFYSDVYEVIGYRCPQCGGKGYVKDDDFSDKCDNCWGASGFIRYSAVQGAK